MAVIVRSPRPDEVYRAAEIGQVAFGTEKIDPWLGSYTWIAKNPGLDHLIVVEADGELVASLVCTPGSARFGEDIVPLCAVGGVATLPEHRRSGYAGMMMEHAVRLLHDKGYHTSALWPFSYAYYRKFGWEVGDEHRRYILSSDFASQLASSDGTRLGVKADLANTSALIDRFAIDYNCVTVRDEIWWESLAATNHLNYDGHDDPRTGLSIVVHETDGAIDGYAFYRVEEAGGQFVVEIRELVTDNAQARAALLSRLSAEGAENIAFYAPLDDNFLQTLPNPRQVRTELHPGFQFRVVNPVAALEKRCIDPSLEMTLGFSISDPVLGTVGFTVEAGDGRISVSGRSTGNVLSMTIQTFSQLYSGYISPVRAFELGRIDSASRKTANLANRLFKSRKPFRSMVELG